MSDQETTENFWKVWNSFQWPEPQPVSYRCYYADDGSPVVYTMEDRPGNYVEISKELYLLSPFNAKVVDGHLKVFEIKKTVKKLKPHAFKGTPCDVKDICIVVEPAHPHILWTTKENEID